MQLARYYACPSWDGGWAHAYTLPNCLFIGQLERSGSPYLFHLPRKRREEARQYRACCYFAALVPATTAWQEVSAPQSCAEISFHPDWNTSAHSASAKISIAIASRPWPSRSTP